MVVNHKGSGKAKSMAVGLAAGTLFSLILTLLGTAITANLILSEKLKTEGIGYVAVTILLLASAVGAWCATGMIKRRRVMVCAGVGGLYYISLLAITALFFGGQYQGMGVTALVVMGGCGAVGLLGLREKKSGRKKIKKYHFR